MNISKDGIVFSISPLKIRALEKRVNTRPPLKVRLLMSRMLEVRCPHFICTTSQPLQHFIMIAEKEMRPGSLMKNGLHTLAKVLIHMNNTILIAKIKNLLAENDGRMAEVEVCKVLSITLQEIPCGYKIPWARLFQVNQTYDLVLGFDQQTAWR